MHSLDPGRILPIERRLSLPLVGEGGPLAVDEVMRRNEFFLPPQIQAHFITLGKVGVTANVGV